MEKIQFQLSVVRYRLSVEFEFIQEGISFFIGHSELLIPLNGPPFSLFKGRGIVD